MCKKTENILEIIICGIIAVGLLSGVAFLSSTGWFIYSHIFLSFEATWLPFKWMGITYAATMLPCILIQIMAAIYV